MNRQNIFAVMVWALLLTACNSGSDQGSTAATSSIGPTATPASALDQVDSKGCLVHYGNPPRPFTQSVDGLLAIQNLCAPLGGEILNWKDADGTARYACLTKPANATVATPLPLLVWVHPSLFPMDTVRLTDLSLKMNTADLSGDPARPGFILLLPEGRDTQHFYPLPDDTGLGWDNWYRNFDRSSPYLNVDAAAIDHFIAETVKLGIVDRKRIYMSGWSNGSAMTIAYALNTPGIAAAAVYSSPNPFGDLGDPCPQTPFGKNPLPIYHVHNDCDIFGICPSGEKLFQDLKGIFPNQVLTDNIIDSALQDATSCNSLCDPGQALGETLGTANHLRWPYNKTDTLLQFLRDHPAK